MEARYRAQDADGQIYDYAKNPEKDRNEWLALHGVERVDVGKPNPNWGTACFDLSEGEPVIIDGILCAPSTVKITPDMTPEQFDGQTHPLESVFTAAIEQATKGKGMRHGGDLTPFMEQPWTHYYGMHGRGFLTGQAAKKLEEAASLRHGPEFESEAIGAIIYLAMAILKEREKTIK